MKNFLIHLKKDTKASPIANMTLHRLHSTIAATSSAAVRSFKCIPGPKSFPLLGSVPYYLPVIGRYDPMNVIQSGMQKFKDFGPIVRERLFSHDAVFLYDPTDIEMLFRQGGTKRRSHLTLGHIRKNSDDHLNGGILYENGEVWAKMRSGSQQSLTSEAFEKYIPRLDKYTLRFLNKIPRDSMMQQVIEKDFLLALLAHNCDSVCYMLFGLELDCMNEILNDDALTTRVIHSSTYFNRMMAPMDNGLMLWKYFPTPLYKTLKACSEDVDFIPKREVQARLLSKSSTNSLGMLDDWMKAGVFDTKTMVTVLSDLLLAGIDTTSYTLAFTLYNISVNERVQDKLFEELKQLDPETNAHCPISIETLSKASYLKKVVKESMRLFPVSVGTSRVLPEPCVIGGYKIPENVQVITMNQITCRLSEYVEQPNEFIPERYEANSGFRKLRPYTMLPFGHGPRACIGRRVAELSIYLFLFRLLRQYKVEWVGQKPLGCHAHSITEPDSPLHFRFSQRISPDAR